MIVTFEIVYHIVYWSIWCGRIWKSKFAHWDLDVSFEDVALVHGTCKAVSCLLHINNSSTTYRDSTTAKFSYSDLRLCNLALYDATSGIT